MKGGKQEEEDNDTEEYSVALPRKERECAFYSQVEIQDKTDYDVMKGDGPEALLICIPICVFVFRMSG
jgi:hypothetical protein